MKLAINLNRAIRTCISNQLVRVFFCAFPITPWSDSGSPGAVLRWSTVSPELTAFLVVSSGERFFAGAGGYLIVVPSGGRPFPGDGDVFSQQKNQLMSRFFCCESELRRNDATSRMAAHLVLRIPQRLYDRNTHLLDIQQWPNQIEDLQVIETADSLLFMFINDCLCFFEPLRY